MNISMTSHYHYDDDDDDDDGDDVMLFDREFLYDTSPLPIPRGVAMSSDGLKHVEALEETIGILDSLLQPPSCELPLSSS